MTATRPAHPVRTIAVLAYPGMELLDAVGPLEAFSNAAALGGVGYAVQVIAERPGLVRASSGLAIEAARGLRGRGPIDTLLVAGGAGVTAACEQGRLVRWIAAMAPQVRRIGSICSGAMLLAEAGLLDGRRAVTHWNWTARLAGRHPAVKVESDPIFVCDGAVWTSAGVSAGIDLALAMIEQDHGRALALRTAQELVMFLKRPGGQSQFSAELQAQETADAGLQALQRWALAHLDEDLSVETLAARACLSPRHFARVFTQATGIAPGEFVERARLQRAKRELEDSDRSIEAVALRCGFKSGDVMRRVFLRRLGISPGDWRHRFSTTAGTVPEILSGV
ncbi:GlxA family transcriptional regulator [Aquabacterium sp. A7-Y]|uniref:GlxA family transcriptional regulator n=1 Tax=Aquabacterium sp. A7-Y TaxID=1349605 RepID=UPI00223DC1BB|nr:GlxA family transcriptional regulator [Aquabacterium sp. A7-Y]MCW7539201.1 GlxA family transcriptional regulator [Aquabacterium sp. A7-Y]